MGCNPNKAKFFYCYYLLCTKNLNEDKYLRNALETNTMSYIF